MEDRAEYIAGDDPGGIWSLYQLQPARYLDGDGSPAPSFVLLHESGRHLFLEPEDIPGAAAALARYLDGTPASTITDYELRLCGVLQQINTQNAGKMQ